MRKGALLAASPDKCPLGLGVVQANPQRSGDTSIAAKCLKDPVVFCLVVDRHQVSAKCNRLSLGLCPISLGEEVVGMSVHCVRDWTGQDVRGADRTCHARDDTE